ncbi:nitroreductase family protein [Victivallis sp. Marseille-Q1083]|uniref:nitroreductase family protein n=1 Tax=Victivallis sp. Marseille-Q1083 TaxID=2717288 RepID=UPI00158CACC2|nr:nitroreductase family protein [Victivallis sp. Marseille-Q1083]
MERKDCFGELVRDRYSCRGYRPDPVPEEMIAYCLEAVRLAPSACNRQPWRLAVVQEPGLRRALCERGVLPGLSMTWMRQAPVLVALALERSLLTHVAAPWLSKVDYSLVDGGIAGEHFVLAAAAQGLGSCWIGWIDGKAVRRLLHWPRSYKVIALFTLGFPADAPKEKIRQPLDKFVRRA